MQHNQYQYELFLGLKYSETGTVETLVPET